MQFRKTYVSPFGHFVVAFQDRKIERRFLFEKSYIIKKIEIVGLFVTTLVYNPVDIIFRFNTSPTCNRTSIAIQFLPFFKC